MTGLNKKKKKISVSRQREVGLKRLQQKLKPQQDENINNLNDKDMHPLQPAVNVDTGEVMLDNVYVVSDEEMRRIITEKNNKDAGQEIPPSELACQEMRPPTPHKMHKSKIPDNAKKKTFNHVGWLGVRGTTAAADPTKFVKCGSGRTSAGDHKVVSDYTKKEKPEKWTRPLHKDFVPKMGKPTPNPPAMTEEENDGLGIPKR